jgi:SAM-dependent methyltransferase
MKTRESDMPPEETWAAFFQPKEALKRLGLSSHYRKIVDFGCGFGTFSVPAAQVCQGTVYALDIEPQMVAATRRQAEVAALTNLIVIQRDFVAHGTGLLEGAIDFAMQFNILHAAERDLLLQEAFRVLRPGGLLAIMHWRYDASTPRGPSMIIRPLPEKMVAWCRAAGFTVAEDAIVDLPPYHYGFTAVRPG